MRYCLYMKEKTAIIKRETIVNRTSDIQYDINCDGKGNTYLGVLRPIGAKD